MGIYIILFLLFAYAYKNKKDLIKFKKDVESYRSLDQAYSKGPVEHKKFQAKLICLDVKGSDQIPENISLNTHYLDINTVELQWINDNVDDSEKIVLGLAHLNDRNFKNAATIVKRMMCSSKYYKSMLTRALEKEDYDTAVIYRDKLNQPLK